MCNDLYNPRLLPLKQTHLEQLCGILPHQSQYLHDVYADLTDSLTPQANLLVLFAALKEAFDKKQFGVFRQFGSVVYAPLSIVAQTAQHEWTRFRTQAVTECHSSFLSFLMAKVNVEKLEKTLMKHGLCLSRGHCCGILLGEPADIAVVEKSDLYAARNQMRSYAESMAMPVQSCSLLEIPVRNSDLTASEITIFESYESYFASMNLPARTEELGVYDDWLYITNPLEAMQQQLRA